MYGNKITTQYGREEGRRRSVIGEIGTAPIGNATFRVGKLRAPEGAEPKGWEITEHVVMRPSEAMAFVAEVVKTVFEHGNNGDELLGMTQHELPEIEQVVQKLLDLADDLGVAEADAGRNEEVV